MVRRRLIRLPRLVAHLLVAVLLLGAFAPRAMAAKTVLGKLGQALKACPIYASTSPRSRVYYRVKPYEYLVVRPTPKKGWVRILLQTGGYGYMPSAAVATLPYEVTGMAPRSARSADPVSFSMRFLGTPYKWGGNDLTGGIDCSGFVKEVFSRSGVRLPRTAAEQALVGIPITRLEHLQPGDRLYFWEKRRNKIGHTGIYLGNGYFVHSSSGRGGVATDNLRNGSWRNLLVAARRNG